LLLVAVEMEVQLAVELAVALVAVVVRLDMVITFQLRLVFLTPL
jgi:hypothetical protein